MTEALIGLGSNLGDRLANLSAARDALSALPLTSLVAVAPVYETEPVDVPAAYAGLAFLNTVAVLATELSAGDLAAHLHALEDRLGRTRGPERNAPRTIDLDLLAFGTAVSDAPHLRLPHPQATRRRFVCQPLADLRPDLVLPGETRTLRQVLAALPPTPRVAVYAERW